MYKALRIVAAVMQTFPAELGGYPSLVLTANCLRPHTQAYLGDSMDARNESPPSKMSSVPIPPLPTLTPLAPPGCAAARCCSHFQWSAMDITREEARRAGATLDTLRQW